MDSHRQRMGTGIREYYAIYLLFSHDEGKMKFFLISHRQVNYSLLCTLRKQQYQGSYLLTGVKIWHDLVYMSDNTEI